MGIGAVYLRDASLNAEVTPRAEKRVSSPADSRDLVFEFRIARIDFFVRLVHRLGEQGEDFGMGTQFHQHIHKHHHAIRGSDHHRRKDVARHGFFDVHQNIEDVAIFGQSAYSAAIDGGRARVRRITEQGDEVSHHCVILRPRPGLFEVDIHNDLALVRPFTVYWHDDSPNSFVRPSHHNIMRVQDFLNYP